MAARQPDGLEERMKELDERERYALKRLRKSIGSGALTAEGVGEILPEAVVISADGGGRLPKSLVETTETAIGISVSQDPAVLSDALFPIIGSAIRKAIERLVSEALFKVNAGLEKGLSAKRLGWRLQSMRTGVPFYEIALKNTLDYRVEQVFLIHKKTGVLLADASMPGPSGIADKDMVASMLTAVRDYIKDSLSLARSSPVDVLSAGDYSIFVEEGPYALMALIVRGTPDPRVRSLAQDALETVHARFGPRLKAFDGETEPFEKAEGFLEPCLVSVDRGAGGKKKPVYALVLLGLLAATGSFFIVRGAIQSARDGAFLAALDAESGIVVVDARRSGGKLRATIMRSAQARAIADLAAELGYDLARTDFDVELYLSLGQEGAVSKAYPAAPAITSAAASAVVPSAAAASSSPISVAAPIAISPAAAPASAPAAPPISTTATATMTADAELRSLASRLAAERILFGKNSSRPLPGQEGRIQGIRALALSIVERAREKSLVPRIEAVGHAAGAVSDAAGDSFSVERARMAIRLVTGSEARLRPYVVFRGAGNAEPIADEEIVEGASQNRSVSFTATFR